MTDPKELRGRIEKALAAIGAYMDDESGCIMDRHLTTEMLHTTQRVLRDHLATLPREVVGWRCNWTYRGYPGGWEFHETQADAEAHLTRITGAANYSDAFISWPHTLFEPGTATIKWK